MLQENLRNCVCVIRAEPIMPFLRALTGILLLAAPILLIAPEAESQTDPAPTVAELSAQIEALKQNYETRIRKLEARLEAMRDHHAAPASPGTSDHHAAPDSPGTSDHHAAPGSAGTSAHGRDSAFNPAIEVILNAAVSEFSAQSSEISGYQLGHESARGREGLNLIETEFSFSANIDDKFYGSSTVGIHSEEDGPETVDLEAAYIQTLPGAGLPDGMRLKAGRALWTLGYLNEQHPHADDFVDRPLPYRVFIDQSYNDNGLEFAYVLPSDMYAEAGVGLFRGDDYPFGDSDTV